MAMKNDIAAINHAGECTNSTEETPTQTCALSYRRNRGCLMQIAAGMAYSVIIEEGEAP
jgi:hypothetical protein